MAKEKKVIEAQFYDGLALEDYYVEDGNKRVHRIELDYGKTLQLFHLLKTVLKDPHQFKDQVLVTTLDGIQMPIEEVFVYPVKPKESEVL